MKIYKSLLDDFSELYLGYASVAIILSSCLGGATAMLILLNGHGFFAMVQLFLVVAVCMIYNSTVLLQMKPKFVFNSLLISLAVSSIVALINIAMQY